MIEFFLNRLFAETSLVCESNESNQNDTDDEDTTLPPYDDPQ